MSGASACGKFEPPGTNDAVRPRMEECSSGVSIIGLLGLSLVFGTLAACGASPRANTEVVNECQPISDEERAAIVFTPSPGNTPEVDATWTHAHRCNVRVVDVREAHERADGQIEGVTSAPLADLPTLAENWDPREAVVLVCRSGRRSARAVEVLESMGFTRTASMTGGMLRWRELELPVVAPDTPSSPVAPARFSPPDAARSSLSALLENSHIPLTRVASLLLQNSEACVDGRETHGIVGTPGGDAGELLLALASIEELASRELSADEVRDVFQAHVANFGRFYLHTDSHAMSALRRVLERLPEMTALRSSSSPDLEAYLRTPPRDDEEILLEHLASPSVVGCGHLRLVLQHPVEYGVRRELARSLIQVVFRELWRHPEHVSFVVLQGEHREEAVLNVRLGHEVRASSNVPAVPPQLGGRSFFVNHPEVSQYIRKEHVALLRSELPWLGELGSEEILENAMSGLAQRQLTSTLRYLARTLPVYDVYFESGAVRVALAVAAVRDED
ncbi:MAG: rhodanese-like domain-containing protein [Polyangiales bacterium]